MSPCPPEGKSTSALPWEAGPGGNGYVVFHGGGKVDTCIAADVEEPRVALRGKVGHPINDGLLCARGATAAFEVSSSKRLLVPMRRAPGSSAWEEVSWDHALNRAAEVLLEARARHWDAERATAPNLAFLGGATAMNEEAYLFARLARHLGAVHLDHQARMCHSATTTALLATLGLPAATHPWEDLAEARWILVLGANPSETHPIAARWMRRAKAHTIVVDPRESGTARGCDLHLPLRPGTDVALLGGLIAYILDRDCIDRDFLESCTDAALFVRSEAEMEGGLFGGIVHHSTEGASSARTTSERVHFDTSLWEYGRHVGLDHPRSVLSALRRHFARYKPALVSEITGLAEADIHKAADSILRLRLGAVVFSMGVTQQTSGVSTIRAAAILQALLGNLRGPGGGLYPMKGHANIQGATDLGGQFTHLPGYLPAPDAPMLEEYGRRHGEAAEARIRALLAQWFDAPPQDAYHLLPRGLPHTCPEVLVLLGQNPLHGSANPARVATELSRMRMIVSIDPFLNDTARFWEDDPTSATEVLALPAAVFAEKPGSRTNACRTVQWQEAYAPPRGQARADVDIIDELWKRLLNRAPLDPVLQRVRWPSARTTRERYVKVFQEIDGACWLYHGQAATLQGSPVGYPESSQTDKLEVGRVANSSEHGWTWPAGQRRLLDAPLPNALGRVRLWAGPCGTEPGLPDGPLPEHYEPPFSMHPNPLHPEVPHHPSLGCMEPPPGFPLLLSTTLVSAAGGCSPRGNRLREGPPQVMVHTTTAAALGLQDGAPVWLETPTARARAVLRVSKAAASPSCVYAPALWRLGAEGTPDLVLPDPSAPHVETVEARTMPCRITHAL